MRHAFRRQLGSECKDEAGVVRVAPLSPALEKEIGDAVQSAETGEYVPLDPARTDAIAQAAARAVQPLVQAGHEAVVLTSGQVRRFFRRIVEAAAPKIVVLSYNEVDPSVQLSSEGHVDA